MRDVVASQIITQLCVLIFFYLTYTFFSILYISNNIGKYQFVKKSYATQTNLMFCLLLLMCVICNNNGDYYSYRNWFRHTYGESVKTDEWIEPIYYWIRSIIPSSYLLFRAIVWGTGVYVYKKLCKAVGVNLILAYALFGIFYLFAYSYARASLGIMIVCYSFVIFIKNESKSVKSYLKALSFFLLATLLHKSCLSLIIILFISLLFRLNRESFMMLAVLFAPLSMLLNSSLDLIGVNVGLSEVQSERYFQTESGTVERGKEINQYYPFLILLILSLYKLYKNKKKLPLYVERVVIATIMILYVATLLTTLDVVFVETISLRFYLMAFVFGLICCLYTIQELNVNKMILFFLIAYNVFFKLYATALTIHYGAKGLVERYYN